MDEIAWLVQGIAFVFSALNPFTYGLEFIDKASNHILHYLRCSCMGEISKYISEMSLLGSDTKLKPKLMSCTGLEPLT